MLILDKSSGLKKASYIVIPDAANLTPSGDFTLEFFGLKWASTATGILYSHWNATGNLRSIIAQFTATNLLQLGLSTLGTSGSSSTLQRTFSPTLGQEYAVTWERSGSTVRCYIDGAKTGTNDTFAGALFNTSANLVIGADVSLGNIFTGSCKAVRFTPGTARYATDSSYTVPSLPLPTS